MTRRARLASLGAVILVGTGLLGLKLSVRYLAGQRLRSLHGHRVYDEKADAGALLQAALERAKAEQKRVLVVLGGNWCDWCLALDDLMKSDPEISSYVAAHFVVLKLDNAAAEALDEAWGQPTQLGVPVLVFLDGAGKVLRVQETVSLEAFGGRLFTHDRQRVLDVLRASG